MTEHIHGRKTPHTAQDWKLAQIRVETTGAPSRRPVTPAELVADLRFRQKAAKVHNLGPRATTELLAQIAIEAGAVDVVDDALDDFCRLSTETLRRVGGDQFPPLPIRGVA